MGDGLKQWGIKKLAFLDPSKKALERAKVRAKSAGLLEEGFKAMSEEQFDQALAAFRQEWTAAYEKHGKGDAKAWSAAAWAGKEEGLARLMALAREVGRRQLGMRHYDSQLVGASLLMEGFLAEMATGEGKTLVAPIAALHDALAGIPVHVVTVNTYLADRDARQLAPFFGRFGLSTGLLVENAPTAIKQEAYGCDVVYGVNHEFAFDYLRAQLAKTPGERVQRVLGSAFIDEVDSILIDEARTPMIMSGQQDENLRVHLAARDIVEQIPADWIDIEEKDRIARPKEKAFAAIEEGFVELGWIEKGHHLYEGDAMAFFRAAQAALNARFIYKKDQHYIVSNGEVMIIDDFTGRSMEGRRWSDGLHQAVEAKERVGIKQDTKTLATITYQNYFRLYQKIAGMTGTAMTQAPEFWSVYGLRVAQAPTNRPVIRQDLPDAVYKTRDEKFFAIVEQAKSARERGQPVLIGTSNIEDAEEISNRLHKAGVVHESLAAKNHAREAMIIAEAGRPGAITVATNMAGRGADISLGGSFNQAISHITEETADWEAKIEEERAAWQIRRQQALDAGGLLVLGSSRHESRRIDNQLRGRSGRQGDPGSSKFLLSLEDELFRVYANSPVMSLLNRSSLMPFGAPLEHPALTRALEKAQGRVEALHATMRQQALEYDNVANDQRKAVYDWRVQWIEGRVNPWEELFQFGVEAVEAAAEQALLEAGGFSENVDIARLDELVSERLGGIPAPDWPLDEAEHWRGDEWARNMAEAARVEWREAFELGMQLDWGRAALLAPMIWALDEAWQDHLTSLSGMRELIHLRAYVQADPKREYQREAINLFKRMRERVSAEACASAFPAARGILAWALAQDQGLNPDGGVIWSAPAEAAGGDLDPYASSLGPLLDAEQAGTTAERRSLSEPAQPESALMDSQRRELAVDDAEERVANESDFSLEAAQDAEAQALAEAMAAAADDGDAPEESDAFLDGPSRLAGSDASAAKNPEFGATALDAHGAHLRAVGEDEAAAASGVDIEDAGRLDATVPSGTAHQRVVDQGKA